MNKLHSMPVFSIIPELVNIRKTNMDLADSVVSSDKSLHEHLLMGVLQDSHIIKRLHTIFY